MKNAKIFFWFLFTLSFSFFLACSENNRSEECNLATDCEDGFLCDMNQHTCHCAPNCGERTCGPTPATCDDPSITCGTCNEPGMICGSGETCEETTGTCIPLCDPHCYDRVCGPTPATCDAPEATCGTCTSGVCNIKTGMCAPTHDKAGDPCKCETAQSCNIPCSTDPAGAQTCIAIDELGNGFCSFGCTIAIPDPADCDADFPGGGCCRDLSGDGSGENFCLKMEYCEIGPSSRYYLETCGTEDTTDCQHYLICIGFDADETGGYCIFPCDCPNPDQDCQGATCTDNGKCVPLPDTPQTGKGGCLPPGSRGLNDFCHEPNDNCIDGLRCFMFPQSTSNKGFCTRHCDCNTGEGCEEPMDCGLPIEGGGCVCSNRCSIQNVGEPPNNSMGWQCYNIGDQANPKTVCIPE
jgi:hypothetical protein